MENDNIQTVSFLERLPIEIRTEVYRNLLSTKYTKRLSTSRQSPLHARLWPGHAYQLDPTILQTSRQVHSEASTVLYHENLFVRIRSPSKNMRRLLNMKGIPVVLEGRKAWTFKHCAMSVDFDRLNTAIKIQGFEHCYVIASDDVQLLCQILLVEHTCIRNIFQDYEFRVTVHRMCDDMLSSIPAHNSPQRRLLEPLTVLRSVPHFEISGAANTEYCASIMTQVSRVGPTMRECFDKAIELKDKAHEIARRDDLEDALKAYKMAFSQLICNCVRRNILETDTSELHPQLKRAISHTHLIILANIASLHYYLGQYEDAHFWASDVRRFNPSWVMIGPTNLRTKLVYVKAMASARLGEEPRAVEELCEGLPFVTRAAYKDQELIFMRREARYLIKGLGGARVLKAMGIGHLWPLVGPSPAV